MIFICPVCNGLQAMRAVCPHCASAMTDGGKIQDYYGPYSPYRPIDDLKMTDGFADYSSHRCIHHLYCAVCGHSYPQPVQEWST